MKTSNEIITHILKPFENKIKIHRCLKKIITLMPPKYKKYILSIQYKGNLLYIKVSHPAIKQELLLKKNEIFSVIKIMHKNNICKEINPKKLFIDYKYTPVPKPPKEIKFYIKKAKDFENRAKNPEIKKIFDEIKKILN